MEQNGNVRQKIVLGAGMAAMLFAGGSILSDTHWLVNLKSLVLVALGTVIAGVLTYSLDAMHGLLHEIRALFSRQGKDLSGLVREIIRLAYISRRHGVGALEEEAGKTEEVFLKKGLELVIDSYDRWEIRDILEKEFDLFQARQESQAGMLRTLGRMAPAFGFVGTIIGLIGVLNHVGQPEEIGSGMAVALLTTLYGLLLSNLVFLPLSKKVASAAEDETTAFTLILEGVMDIADGRNSKAVAHRLRSYLAMKKATSENGRPALRPTKAASGPLAERRENA